MEASPRIRSLRAELNSLTPQGRREEGYRLQCLSLLDVDDVSFDRHHFVPGHFTASAFVLSPDRASLLLIFHGKLKRWLQPGGHIDPMDASVEDAARREVQEETGLEHLTRIGDGVFDVDVHEIPALKGEPKHLHHDIRYLFCAPNLDARAGSDARGVRWVSLQRVSSVESDESVVRAVEKILAGPITAC